MDRSHEGRVALMAAYTSDISIGSLVTLSEVHIMSDAAQRDGNYSSHT